MRELSEVKDSLDMEVKQNFIDPLQNLHDKDLREIQVSEIGEWAISVIHAGALFLKKSVFKLVMHVVSPEHVNCKTV